MGDNNKTDLSKLSISREFDSFAALDQDASFAKAMDDLHNGAPKAKVVPTDGFARPM